MADLVVTCPKGFWTKWLAEGDLAGGTSPMSSTEWGWYIGGRRPPIQPGDRLYVVAWDRLRGYAPVTRLMLADFKEWFDAASRPDITAGNWCICRRGGAEAVTIPDRIGGFRGWRKRWWPRDAEEPFPGWELDGVLFKRRKAA